MLMCVVTNFVGSIMIGGTNIFSNVFWITSVVADKGLCFDIVLEGDVFVGLMKQTRSR